MAEVETLEAGTLLSVEQDRRLDPNAEIPTLARMKGQMLNQRRHRMTLLEVKLTV